MYMNAKFTSKIDNKRNSFLLLINYHQPIGLEYSISYLYYNCFPFDAGRKLKSQMSKHHLTALSMKKYYLATVLLLLPLPAILAQTFGVKAGLNFPSMLVKDDDETYSDNNKMKLGFHLGGVVEMPLTDALSIEGSVLMSLKGGKSVEEFGDYKYTVNGNLVYISIPVTARYTFDLGDIKLYGLAGPYLAVGVSGKYKSKVEYNGDEETDTESVDWGNDSENDDLKGRMPDCFLEQVSD
jgi:hypothetical protein